MNRAGRKAAPHSAEAFLSAAAFFFALAFLAAAGPADAGDIHGHVLLSYQKKAGGVRVIRAPADSLKSPIIVFLRGNGMITTRRGGPKMNVIRLTPSGPEPALLVARLADSLRIVNEGPETRRCFFWSGATTEDLSLPAGEAVVRRLGTFGPAEILTEKGIRAYVLVLENPFQTEARSGGRFLLDGVTPGEYQVCAWQAGHPLASATAVVPLDGETSVRITLR